MYTIGLGLFTVASAAWVGAQPTTLVLAQVAQGVAGAIVMPQVLAIIGVTCKNGDYVRALSAYGLGLGRTRCRRPSSATLRSVGVRASTPESRQRWGRTPAAASWARASSSNGVAAQAFASSRPRRRGSRESAR